ncbi:hypothetical protein BN1221_02184 [Brenneria goodwinii]|uniref:Uncharacterized protein n=1 Tax=Brenneria goodwinii TaxID=1109412 RepID=A0A0G4JUW0_9GAMM|nr:hypothetical protein BN1221_02184 [Brenneria goodwinii]
MIWLVQQFFWQARHPILLQAQLFLSMVGTQSVAKQSISNSCSE